MESLKAFLASPFSSLLIFFLIIISLCGGKASSEEHRVKPPERPVVEKGQRKTLLVTEYGEISATDVKGHRAPPHHLQFFTLEPNSVFLPVLLHAAMVFYVHTGSGRLTWANEHGTGTIDLREGDVCSLREGSVFYIQSNLEAERKKLRIYAMFTNTDDSTYDAYSRINELVKGFDKKIVQAAFKVPEDLVEAITNKTDTTAIVHAVSGKHNTVWELEASFLKYFLGVRSNSKKVKTYNIFDNDPDFKNRNGWTLTVTKKKLKALKRHNVGFLMVNLAMGSMLGPHWNPRATEVAVVLQGEGMVRVVCGSSNDDKTECQNMRFRVKQGDVFVVPRFHAMAQMSFSKEPLVFVGFSTAAKENHPQFLAGKGSVLQILDKKILATSLRVSKTTVDQLLASPDDSIIFECNSCAEEEEKIMKEEKEKEKDEEEEGKRKREEEEAKKKEEEEEEKERRRRKEEEEEARKKEEERKREEEEARRQQEERERRREEEEARGQEEEGARRKQERERREREEAAQREQEKARRQQKKREKKREEEARREKEREREEEEARREKERARRRGEEEARRERERKEEEARREREREEEKRREEEAEREKQERREEAEREEEAARRQEEKTERRREEEEARRERETEEEEERRREEKAKREQERAKRQEERRRKEAAAEREEEAAKRQQERRREEAEEEARIEEEREREEEQAEREGGGGRRRQKGGEKGRSSEEAAEWEQEEARRQQEEREKKRERESDNKSMQRKVQGQSNGSSVEGTRVLKMRKV